jgi:hypothetical protein
MMTSFGYADLGHGYSDNRRRGPGNFLPATKNRAERFFRPDRNPDPDPDPVAAWFGFPAQQVNRSFTDLHFRTKKNCEIFLDQGCQIFLGT